MKNIPTNWLEKKAARQAVKKYDKETRMTPEKRKIIEKIRNECKENQPPKRIIPKIVKSDIYFEGVGLIKDFEFEDYTDDDMEVNNEH